MKRQFTAYPQWDIEVFGPALAPKKKILIIGHKRHGKDTVAGYLNGLFGYKFESSSEAACRIFLFDALKDKYGYETPKDCFEDRMDKREEWYTLICEYNKEDKARLAKEILKTSNIYVGMRDNTEIAECKAQGLFDLIIGVFDPRKELESNASFNIDLFKESDIIIPNVEGLEELKQRVLKLNAIF